jgi:inorganic pyrophosphatase
MKENETMSVAIEMTEMSRLNCNISLESGIVAIDYDPIIECFAPPNPL